MSGDIEVRNLFNMRGRGAVAIGYLREGTVRVGQRTRPLAFGGGSERVLTLAAVEPMHAPDGGADALGLVFRERPDVVITTGAAPGYFGVRFGKWLGARVVWVDSVANAEELSLSGEKAGTFVDLWLTQWAHLAREGGPECLGSVL